MDIVSRMKLYMEHCHLTSSQFADNAGIPRPTLSQLFNGRNKSNEGAKKISSDIIRKLHDAYPSLNVMWLLFGDGDMEVGENNQFSEPQNGEDLDLNLFQDAENQEIEPQILFEDELSDFETKKSNEAILAEKPRRTDKFIDPVADMRRERPTLPGSLSPDKSKRVQSIMVFYSDNSFEIFKPAE